LSRSFGAVGKKCRKRAVEEASYRPGMQSIEVGFKKIRLQKFNFYRCCVGDII
jgi:hypothetical protein